MPSRLIRSSYLAFPFRMGSSGPVIADRAAHVRGQLEQVLFTLRGERVFRPEFGAGVKALVFEPNGSALWEITKRRLVNSLAEALSEEVAPKSIGVEVEGNKGKLVITVSYVLARIGHEERLKFLVRGS